VLEAKKIVFKSAKYLKLLESDFIEQLKNNILNDIKF